MQRVNVGIIEPVEVLEAALASMLSRLAPDNTVLGSPTEVDDALEAGDLDVLLLGPSCSMPTCLSWPPRCAASDAGLVALRNAPGSVGAGMLLRAGFHGLLDEHVTSSELLFALSEAANRRCFQNAHLREELAQGSAAAGLTNRECEILELLVSGLSNKCIARSIGTSVKTIDSQLSRLYRKLNVESRTQAVLMALDRDASR